jgi:hypothetical protein
MSLLFFYEGKMNSGMVRSARESRVDFRRIKCVEKIKPGRVDALGTVT